MGRVYDSAPVRDSEAGARAVDLLTRFVEIPSVTGSEGPLVHYLEDLFREGKWKVEVTDVSPGRRNLFVHAGSPSVVFTTHADTVPPYFPPRREGGRLFGRGACDAKASLAAQAAAFESLAGETPEVGLLVVIGEERGSDGALAANLRPPTPAPRYLVGGEPTGNEFVAGCKGCLRVAIETRGKAGHSSTAAPRSAVDPLLDVLSEIRALRFPEDPDFGTTTANIGVLEAGTAPNVVADRGRAEILFRTGAPVAPLLASLEALCAGRAELAVPYRSDPIAFRVPAGRASRIVSFACDLPLLSAWGEPILVGPGDIADAHAAEEKVELSEVERAVGIYADLARRLLGKGEESLAPSRSH
jgi:acetylornithine deacetylase